MTKILKSTNFPFIIIDGEWNIRDLNKYLPKYYKIFINNLTLVKNKQISKRKQLSGSRRKLSYSLQFLNYFIYKNSAKISLYTNITRISTFLKKIISSVCSFKMLRNNMNY